MIAATRLRSGNANSARGAARLVADALKTAKACGLGEQQLVSAAAKFEFTSRREGEQFTGRLIVRRVKRLNRAASPRPVAPTKA